MKTVIKRKGVVVLSETHVKIIKKLSDGRTAFQIGEVLGLSPRTVESHIQSMKGKYKSENVTHLVATMLRNKVIK